MIMGGRWERATVAAYCRSGRHATPTEARIAVGDPLCRIGGGKLIRCRGCAELEGYTFDPTLIQESLRRLEAYALQRAQQPSVLPSEPPAWPSRSLAVATALPPPLVRTRRRRRRAAPKPSVSVPFDHKTAAAGRDD